MMISLRYAQNLAAGDGLVWNPGDRVEGITNFLWTLFFVPCHWWLAQERIALGAMMGAIASAGITVAGAARMVLEMTEHPAEIKYLIDMPTGPINRVADNAVAKDLLGWEPKILFKDGLRRTIDWYYNNKTREEVTAVLDGGGFIARQLPKKVLS